MTQSMSELIGQLQRFVDVNQSSLMERNMQLNILQEQQRLNNAPALFDRSWLDFREVLLIEKLGLFSRRERESGLIVWFV